MDIVAHAPKTLSKSAAWFLFSGQNFPPLTLFFFILTVLHLICKHYPRLLQWVFCFMHSIIIDWEVFFYSYFFFVFSFSFFSFQMNNPEFWNPQSHSFFTCDYCLPVEWNNKAKPIPLSWIKRYSWLIFHSYFPL